MLISQNKGLCLIPRFTNLIMFPKMKKYRRAQDHGAVIEASSDSGLGFCAVFRVAACIAHGFLPYCKPTFSTSHAFLI